MSNTIYIIQYSHLFNSNLLKKKIFSLTSKSILFFLQLLWLSSLNAYINFCRTYFTIYERSFTFQKILRKIAYIQLTADTREMSFYKIKQQKLNQKLNVNEIQLIYISRLKSKGDMFMFLFYQNIKYWFWLKKMSLRCFNR